MSENEITRLSLRPPSNLITIPTIDIPLSLDFRNINSSVPNNSGVGLSFSAHLDNTERTTTAEIISKITDNNLSSDLEFHLIHLKDNGDSDSSRELKSKMVLSSGSSENNNDISLNLINPYLTTSLAIL